MKKSSIPNDILNVTIAYGFFQKNELKMQKLIAENSEKSVEKSRPTIPPSEFKKKRRITEKKQKEKIAISYPKSS